MEKLQPLNLGLKMAVINVIEAEMTVTKKGNLRIFIIKDKKLKEVSKYVRTKARENPDLYDYFSYICFRNEKGKYCFMHLLEEQIKNKRKIKNLELLDCKKMNTKRNTYIEKAKVMKPWLGMTLYLMYTVVMSTNNYVSKAIFTLNPNVDVFQLSFARGCIAFLMMMVKINKRAKIELWEKLKEVETAKLPYLAFRCFQGGACLFIMFMAIKYFPVSTVGIVCVLAQPLTLMLAYLFLDENVTCFDVMTLIFVLSCVLVIMVAAVEEETSTAQASIWVTISLMCQPFLIALGNMSVKQLGSISEALCSTYQQLSLALLAGCYLVCTGQDFSFLT